MVYNRRVKIEREEAQKESANVVETGRFFPLGTIISIVLVQSKKEREREREEG
jgi:hypothetical protein